MSAPILRAIRSGDMTLTPDGLEREYQRVAALSADRWRPGLDEETRNEVEAIVMGLMRRLVAGRQETDGMDGLAGRLESLAS